MANAFSSKTLGRAFPRGSRSSQSPLVNARPSVSGQATRDVGSRATMTHAAPMHRKARERGFRVDFRQCVRVASNQLGRFEPRDRCSSESAPSRRACVRVPKRERLPACVAGGRRATCPHSRRKPCAYKTKADLPAFALALWRVRRSLGGGGKVRLYVRQTVAGRVRNDPPYERTVSYTHLTLPTNREV